jgi:hypothetical protein
MYAWPFELRLPDDLPGSLESDNFEGNYIRYELAAYFVEYDRPESLMEFIQPLRVVEGFRPQISPLEGTVRSQPTKNCCWSAGEVGIFVRISSTCLKAPRKRVLRRRSYRGAAEH